MNTPLTRTIPLFFPGLARSSAVLSPPTIAWRLAQLRFFAAGEQCWPQVTEMCARRPEIKGWDLLRFTAFIKQS